MRLVPIRALEHTETEWIKVADTKGCIGKRVKNKNIWTEQLKIMIYFSFYDGANAHIINRCNGALSMCCGQTTGIFLHYFFIFHFFRLFDNPPPPSHLNS